MRTRFCASRAMLIGAMLVISAGFWLTSRRAEGNETARLLSSAEMAAIFGDAPDALTQPCKCTLDCTQHVLRTQGGTTVCAKCGFVVGSDRYVCSETDDKTKKYDCNPTGGGGACGTKKYYETTEWDLNSTGTCGTKSCTFYDPTDTSCRDKLNNASGDDCPK